MKSKILNSILALFIFFSILSCIKEVKIDVDHEAQYVIYGNLTNSNKKVSIKIHKTLPVNSTKKIDAVNDATVSLYEKLTDGTVKLVTSDFTVENGIYTSNEAIIATEGNSYWIEVVLKDGSKYKSAEEKMKPSIPIKEITTDKTFDDLLNVKFSDPGNEVNFYKVAINYYLKDELVYSHSSVSNDVVFNGNDKATVEIELFGVIEEGKQHPNWDTREVTLGNINFESYQFILNKKMQSTAQENAMDSEGGDPSQLFSTPPVYLIGNITNVATKKRALGNFTVSAESVSSKIKGQASYIAYDIQQTNDYIALYGTSNIDKEQFDRTYADIKYVMDRMHNDIKQGMLYSNSKILILENEKELEEYNSYFVTYIPAEIIFTNIDGVDETSAASTGVGISNTKLELMYLCVYYSLLTERGLKDEYEELKQAYNEAVNAKIFKPGEAYVDGYVDEIHQNASDQNALKYGTYLNNLYKLYFGNGKGAPGEFSITTKEQLKMQNILGYNFIKSYFDVAS